MKLNKFDRITPEQVVSAYELTGITPISSEWGYETPERKCGCALTAIAYSQVINDGTDFVELLHDMEESRGRIIGNYPEAYLIGFVNGFDDAVYAFRKEHDEIYRQGVIDGEATHAYLEETGYFHKIEDYKEVVLATFEIPVGLTGELNEFFLDEESAKQFSEKHNVKLLHVITTKISQADFERSFPQHT